MNRHLSPFNLSLYERVIDGNRTHDVGFTDLSFTIKLLLPRKNEMKRSWTDAQLIAAVQASKSLSAVARDLGLVATGGSTVGIKRRIKELNLDISHFDAGKSSPRTGGQPLADDRLFCIDSTATRGVVKRHIIKRNLIEYRCSECGLQHKWNDKPLSLELDHINGIYNDHRLENLRFLCPNCHSQTPTHGNKGGKRFYRVESSRKQKRCLDCGVPITLISNRCTPCAHMGLERINWPSQEELEKLIWKFPTSKLAKELGVSDKAIEKRCKKLGISKPPRGYWSRR